jgi:uncharacterized membrane protein
MVECSSLLKSLMQLFQKYQQNEIVKVREAEGDPHHYSNDTIRDVAVAQQQKQQQRQTAREVLKVHTASQVALLMTVVNLSTIESARTSFKQNETFMRVLKVVAAMHRHPSMKGTADSAYQNITKNAQIQAPATSEKSVHKYTRSNTVAFYASAITMGFSYGFAWALRMNALHAGLKGTMLIAKSIPHALQAASGSILLGGYFRDAQAVATNPKVRKYTEASSAHHSVYTALKVGYFGVGAFVIGAAFPHVVLPSIAANMCLGSVVKGIDYTEKWLNQRKSTKEKTPQKKLA